MASAFNVSALTAYTNENTDLYISSLITGAKTIQIIQSEGNVQTGIKTSERIHGVEVDATWLEGDGCGFTPTGSTALTQRLLTVGNIKINLEWCMDDLIGFYTQEMMKKGALNERESMPAPLESRILDRLTAKQNRDMDRAVWQGDTASGSDKLEHFDGFIKLIDAAGTAVYSNMTAGTGTITAATNSTGVAGVGTNFDGEVAVGDKLYSGGTLIGTVATVTDDDSIVLGANAAVAVTGGAFYILKVADQAAFATTNAIARIDALYGAIPEAVLNSDGARLWVGLDDSRTWLRALTTANMFHYTANGNDVEDGFVLPGTNLRVTPVPGLSGTGRRFVIDPKNMWFGTDLENEWERFKMWYNEEDEMLRLKARWRAGVQIGFPEEITSAR